MGEDRVRVRRVNFNDISTAEKLMAYIGVDDGGIEVMAPKTKYVNLLIDGVKPPAANILKQEMLALGGECANARDVIMGEPLTSSSLLIGNIRQLNKLVRKLRFQPFWDLDEIADMIEHHITAEISSPKVWSVRNDSIDLSNGPIVMGIINTTPDSFYDGGKYSNPDVAFERAKTMIEEGADIIDIGGVSTRPGSTPPSEDEELERIIPVIEKISKLDVHISADTYRSCVARQAIEAGANIINDISALRFDEEMLDVVSETRCGLVLMHMKGTPKDMQENPEYDDAVDEVYNFLNKRVKSAIDGGIEAKKIVIDVGVGFGKRLKDNLDLMGSIDTFKAVGRPILLGASRKSFIKDLLGLPEDERLTPSVIVAIYSYIMGVSIFRVHDVREIYQGLKMVKSLITAPVENILEREE